MLPGGNHTTCMVWGMFPGLDMDYTDPARYLVTAGYDLCIHLIYLKSVPGSYRPALSSCSTAFRTRTNQTRLKKKKKRFELRPLFVAEFT